MNHPKCQNAPFQFPKSQIRRCSTSGAWREHSAMPPFSWVSSSTPLWGQRYISSSEFIFERSMDVSKLSSPLWGQRYFFYPSVSCCVYQIFERSLFIKSALGTKDYLTNIDYIVVVYTWAKPSNQNCLHRIGSDVRQVFKIIMAMGSIFFWYKPQEIVWKCNELKCIYEVSQGIDF